MASVLIHLAVAKEFEEKTKPIKNKYDYYLGAIAPDLAKQIGLSRDDSHFVKNTYEPDIPNLQYFEMKYPKYRENDYDLGYYVHLYTDKLWEKEFLKNITSENSIRLLDGTIIASNSQEIKELMYSDYTNLNVKLIETYDIDLSLFYEEFKVPNTDITEIPADKLDILINKMGIIIQNSKEEKTYLLDITEIKNFIDDTVERLIKELEVI